MAQTRIVCHRGAMLSAPENTFASAEAALALGGSVIELDIHQSRDGVLYVLHDDTVDRTTNGSGPIAEMTSREIDALDAGSHFDPRFAGEPVPRLDAYLARFADRAGFYLEVKRADCAAVAKLVDDLDISAACFTSSFEADIRRDMRRFAPGIRHMVHWEVAGSVQAVRAEHGAEIVEFFARNFDAPTIRAAQAEGLEVMFYTDALDIPRFREALQLGMDYLNIDHIAEARALMSERQG